MGTIQLVPINESILDYFRMSMDFDNESEDYRKITEQEFKDELAKALNCGLGKKQIKWIKNK